MTPLPCLYDPSDEQAEFQINDRHSFCQFLDLPLGGSAPDCTPIWKFRDALRLKARAVKELFDLFTGQLEAKGPVTRKGTIITIDHHQRDLGAASCGPDAQEQYPIRPGNCQFSFTLSS